MGAIEDVLAPGARKKVTPTLDGVFLGVITQVSGWSAHFRVPDTLGRFQVGPAPIVRTYLEAEEGEGGPDLSVGDQALVAFIQGDVDAPVVIGKLG